MGRTHDVRIEGLQRTLVRESHERLGGKMEDEVGRNVENRLSNGLRISNIAANVPLDPPRQTKLRIERGTGRDAVGVTG